MQGKKIQEKQAKRVHDERNKQQQKVTNTQSEKYIIAKFNREFEHLIQELFSNDIH